MRSLIRRLFNFKLVPKHIVGLRYIDPVTRQEVMSHEEVNWRYKNLPKIIVDKAS